MLSIFTALYTLALVYAFYFGGPAVGVPVLLAGIIAIALFPTYRNSRIETAKNLIQNPDGQPFININKDPWYIIAVLPNIERVAAKRAVYIRRHYGNYKSLEDFFEKMNIKAEDRESISKHIHI